MLPWVWVAAAIGGRRELFACLSRTKGGKSSSSCDGIDNGSVVWIRLCAIGACISSVALACWCILVVCIGFDLDFYVTIPDEYISGW